MVKENDHLKIAIIMGSDSDWEIMKKAAVTLKEHGVAFEVKVASAHRTPDAVQSFARNARKDGFAAIIAGAGAAAHLAGVIAANTSLPVIAVPIDASPLRGVDALYASVQMPSGIPVATVAINGSKNAAILALEILSIFDKRIEESLNNDREEMKRTIEKKNEKINKDLEDL